MRYFNAIAFHFTFFLLFSALQANACGFDWVGDCSSSVHLSINGTLDSFDIADCPAGFRFQGMYLGSLRTLSLSNARAITWESCINNVSAVTLKYRVYEQGGGAGSFQSLGLTQQYFTVLGPYTTRYRSQASNIDLSTGLSVGKTYVLEVYFVADVDTIGDDFIPETTLLKNNNGQNYKLTFTYGGPTAPPFVVIPTNVQEPKCHGESNGVAGVSVWGDHTGLFYNWSNINLNFYQQNNIPAGTYTVTVTGINYSESNTIVLGEPAPLAAQFSNIQPVSCGGGQGMATVMPMGGTAPYHYLWQTGQTDASAVFLNSGAFTVSVSDAHNCSLNTSVNIPGTGNVQQNSSLSICTGEIIQVGNTVIDKAGVYNILIAGSGGCDTLLTLTVYETNPATLLANIPASIVLACNAPSVNLCAETAPDALYQWSKDGIPATPTPCLLATAGGTYKITVVQNGCTASKSIVSEEHLVAPIISAYGSASYIMDCYEVDSTVLTIIALSDAIGPQFEWMYEGQTISTNDTCIIGIDGVPPQIPLAITVKVTDQFGCVALKQPTVVFVQLPVPPYLFFDFEPNLCLGLTEVELNVLGGNPPFTFTLNDSIPIGNEFLVAPGGDYLVKATDINGCSTTLQLVGIQPHFLAIVEDAPNPNWNSGSISIYPADGAWFDFQWEDGDISSNRYLLAPGEYCVTITDVLNGCSLDTCFTVHGSVAAQEPETADLRIVPNPAAPGDWIRMALPEKMMGSPLQVVLEDVQGKKIQAVLAEYSSNGLTIRLPEHLEAGIAFLKIISVNGQMLGKIVLNK